MISNTNLPNGYNFMTLCLRVCVWISIRWICMRTSQVNKKFIPFNSHSFSVSFVFIREITFLLDICAWCELKGQWVWIKPPKVSEFATPIGCQIIRFDRGKVLIRNDDGDESWIKPDQVSKKKRFSHWWNYDADGGRVTNGAHDQLQWQLLRSVLYRIIVFSQILIVFR